MPIMSAFVSTRVSTGNVISKLSASVITSLAKSPIAQPPSLLTVPTSLPALSLTENLAPQRSLMRQQGPVTEAWTSPSTYQARR